MPAIGCAAVVNLTLRFRQTHRIRRFYCRCAADRGPRNLGSLLQGVVQPTMVGVYNPQGVVQRKMVGMYNPQGIVQMTTVGTHNPQGIVGSQRSAQ